LSIIVEIYLGLRNNLLSTDARCLHSNILCGTRAIRSIFTARRYTNALHAVVVYLSVRLSVCVSVTLQYCVKTAERRITQIMPYDRDILVAEFLLTSASRGPSAIAELLVLQSNVGYVRRLRG